MSSLTCARCGKISYKGHCHEHDDCLVNRLSAISLYYRLYTREHDNIQEINLSPGEVSPQSASFNSGIDNSNDESRATNVADGQPSHSFIEIMNNDHGPEVQFHRTALMNSNYEFPFAFHNKSNSIPELIPIFPLIPRPIFFTSTHQDMQTDSAQIRKYYQMTESSSDVLIDDSSSKCYLSPYQKQLLRNSRVLSELQRQTEAHQLPSSRQMCEIAGYDPRAVAGPSRSREDERIRPSCGKTFPPKAKLGRHSVVHSKKKSFVCEVCQKCFNQKYLFKRHMLSHSGKKCHECGECRKAFHRRDELKVHMRIHTGEKPFTCDTCGKAFSHSGSLTTHVRIHTGRKPYTCDNCGKAFRQQSTLKRHVFIQEKEKKLLKMNYSR